MYKVLVLALREYLSSVKTKGFIISLIIVPIFMGGSLIVFALFKDKVDITTKNIHVVDFSEKIGKALVDAAEFHNRHEILDTASGKQVKPEYNVVLVEPDTVDPFSQRLKLSDMVRSKEIHAFVIISPDIVHPEDKAEVPVKYYSENSFMDDIRWWLDWPVNNRLRQIRLAEMGLDENELGELFNWINVKGMGLVQASASGEISEDARESNPAESIVIPYILMMLLFMMIIMSAIPLLSSVMEEKTERIAEVLLGSINPFQFMMGKVLGGVSVSLTIAVVYILGGLFIANQANVADLIPMEIIPWFFVYLLFSIVMYGSIMAALGSACNDSKDAQSMQFPAMLPILIPIFVMMPVLKEPMGSFATTMSLIPPFTPFLMLVRQTLPVTIPVWQPIAGLLGIALFTFFSVWAGGKIFRTLILIQGKKPKLSTLIGLLFKK